MEKNNLLVRIRKEGHSFFEEAGKANENVYLILLTLYAAIFLMMKVAWTEQAEKITTPLRYGFLSIVIWCSALYLFFIITAWKDLWKKNAALFLVGGTILTAAYLFSRKMSTNLYGAVMDVFFCLMAYKKNFRKMLYCILGAAVFMLIIAGIGLKAGFTMSMQKPDTDIPGHALGINYPNTWGYLAFLVILIIWYLWLRFKPVVTLILFWAVCVFMYKYITCRTIAGITLVFPVLAVFVDMAEKYADRKAEEGMLRCNIPLKCTVTAIPFIVFAFMMFSSMQVDWWHQFYHGPLRNLAWRFIQGGLYFRTYGLPLIGNPYRSNQFTFVNVRGEFIKVGILDSSFAAYIIMRGILWLIYTLAWLCAAIWKALKKRDYAIPFIELIILLFAMMERPGLEMWYNFVMLYPLAKVVSKPGTEIVKNTLNTAVSGSQEIEISADRAEKNLQSPVMTDKAADISE